jgi:hypothetical protein
MIVRHLNASDLGKTITLPTLAALGRCRSGTLHSITVETATDTSAMPAPIGASVMPPPTQRQSKPAGL